MSNYNVNEETLVRYCAIVGWMRRIMHNPACSSILAQMDMRRADLHDQLCKQAGVEKSNHGFTIWLDELLSKLGDDSI